MDQGATLWEYEGCLGQGTVLGSESFVWECEATSGNTQQTCALGGVPTRKYKGQSFGIVANPQWHGGDPGKKGGGPRESERFNPRRKGSIPGQGSCGFVFSSDNSDHWNSRLSLKDFGWTCSDFSPGIEPVQFDHIIKSDYIIMHAYACICSQMHVYAGVSMHMHDIIHMYTYA